MVEIRRLYVFLALFTFVYFLESIGGTYMITAVQNIERHFQIPSKVSGFLVSAHDISYCLLVIQISYFGSKGNRAKWIGFGTIMMALAHMLTSSPNFMFPTTTPQLNTTQLEEQLRPNSRLFRAQHQDYSAFLDYAPIRDRLPIRLRQMLRKIWEDHSANDSGIGNADEQMSSKLESTKSYNYTDKNPYSLDEPIISEIYIFSDLLFSAKTKEERENASTHLTRTMRHFVANRQEFPEADLKTMRRAAAAPFAFCHKLINQMRELLLKTTCQRSGSNIGPLFLIFGAMLVLGFGRTMPWSLGVPLIDDNVKKQQMPIYFAMINFFKILGPICGFLIGSIVNKIYYTFPASAPKGLTAQDPTWIGAWWLGFLFIGVVMIGPSFALFFFPESSSSKKKKQQQSIILQNGGNNHQIHQQKYLNGKIATDFHSLEKIHKNEGSTITNGKIGSDNGNGGQKERRKLALVDRHVEKDVTGDGKKLSNFSAFIRSYREVLNSRVYVGASIARMTDVFAFKGYMVFLPKFLENHYGIPRYMVHIYMAVFGVLGFAFGAASGGFITRKLRLNGRKAAIYVLVISIINTSLFALKSQLGCHSVVNRVGRDGIVNNFNYSQQCNSECGCESAKLYPVCDSTGQVYYSPCHAGCRHVEVINLEKYQLEFSECDCLPSDAGNYVSKDLCFDDCKWMKYAFFGIVVVGAFLAGTAMVPGMLLLLRSVPPQTRSPALGLQGFLVSSIGTLPSPILWGWLIDSACQIWDYDCHGRGACQIYDPWTLRMRMHWLYVCIRLFSLVADIYVCVHAKGLNLQEEEDEDGNGKEPTEIERAKALGQETITLEAIPT